MTIEENVHRGPAFDWRCIKLIGVNTCKLCDNVFQRTQGLKLHMTRMHKNVGVTCEKPFNDESEVKKHIELEHKKALKEQRK